MPSWVKLHHSTLDSSIMQDDWHFRLFAWCLLKANYRPVSFQGTTIEPGQFVTGRLTGADALNVSPSKFYRGLETLRDKYQSISIATNNKWTTITICKWQTYQSSEDEKSGKVNSEWTADEQRMNNERTTNEHNLRSKEDKKERKEETPPNPQTGERHAIAQAIVNQWNSTPGVVLCRSVTSKRVQLVSVRSKNPAWDWQAALLKFPLRCFAGNDRNWKPDIDWFLKPDSVLNILEGKYDWEHKAESKPSTNQDLFGSLKRFAEKGSS